MVMEPMVMEPPAHLHSLIHRVPPASLLGHGQALVLVGGRSSGHTDVNPCARCPYDTQDKHVECLGYRVVSAGGEEMNQRRRRGRMSEGCWGAAKARWK